MQALAKRTDGIWEVPYLPIDPSDIGREYEPVVRINSQSGKGGVAFVMDSFYEFRLPKGMHKEFADIIQRIVGGSGRGSPEQIMDEFRINYLDRKGTNAFQKCQITDREYEGGGFATVAHLIFTDHGEEREVDGVGNGPIDAIQKRTRRCTRHTDPCSGLRRACTPLRFGCAGGFLYSPDECGNRRSDIRSRNQLQYYAGIDPRYIQRCKQIIL